jgi:hypothetical protein
MWCTAHTFIVVLHGIYLLLSLNSLSIEQLWYFLLFAAAATATANVATQYSGEANYLYLRLPLDGLLPAFLLTARFMLFVSLRIRASTNLTLLPFALPCWCSRVHHNSTKRISICMDSTYLHTSVTPRLTLITAVYRLLCFSCYFLRNLKP